MTICSLVLAGSKSIMQKYHPSHCGVCSTYNLPIHEYKQSAVWLGENSPFRHAPKEGQCKLGNPKNRQWTLGWCMRKVDTCSQTWAIEFRKMLRRVVEFGIRICSFGADCLKYIDDFVHSKRNWIVGPTIHAIRPTLYYYRKPIRIRCMSF